MAQLVQTLQVSVPEKIDVETQTVYLSDDNTITRSALSRDTSGNSILYGDTFAPGMIKVYANIQRRGWQSLSRRKEDDDDIESIKASMLAYRRGTVVEDSPAAMQSDLAPVKPSPPEHTNFKLSK